MAASPRGYNGFGQLTSEAQTITPGGVPGLVTYSYSETPLNATNTGLLNHSRPTGLTYPNSRLVSYGYGSSLDDRISRLDALTESGGTSVLESLTYLGLGTVVERSHQPQAFNHRLIYLAQAGDGLSDSLDPYRGLDQFGRVREQRWRTGATDTDRFAYGYNWDSEVDPIVQPSIFTSRPRYGKPLCLWPATDSFGWG